MRRTLACARGEKATLVAILFIENLLGLWVLSSFVQSNNWALALCYAGGLRQGQAALSLSQDGDLSGLLAET